MRQRSSLLVSAVVASIIGMGPWAARGVWAQPAACVGDCDDDNAVTINEIITGVNIALDSLSLDTCPSFDADHDGMVTVNELVVGVNNALGECGSQANRAPHASDVSLSVDSTTPYLVKQLIASDPDDDTITYELLAADAGTGYDFAYVNPESGVLYLTFTPDFQGTIVLPYHVTDGKLFSNTASATLQVQATIPAKNGGSQDIDPKVYATYPRGFYDGTLLGAPGANPTLPPSVDLSKDFPRPGDQGQQFSCVGWALGYALKTYQERVELGWSLEAAEHRFSPAYIYNQINGGRDNGSVFADGLNLVVNQGVATLAQMPYDDRDFLTQPSDAARQEASQFRGKSWKAANGILEIKDALANHLAVLVAIRIFDELYGLRGPDSVYNTFDGAFHGGHAVAAVGYDDARYGGALRIINSWSQNWGDGGYFWLPYTAATQTVTAADGTLSVLPAAAVIEDLADPVPAPPDPVDPPPPAQLPDLQVTDWTANFDGMPGGSGSLQYTVTNTGTATAAAGAYVALLLSRDATFTATNTLVVYEPIPFDMAPGTTAYRDQNNAIAFSFPPDLAPGQYYMALWVDIWNDVVEAHEANNISPATNQITIVNTRPDMEVITWYSVWDAFGDGSLIYNLVNNGASTAPAGWLITLALSPNDIIGDGDEIFLFSEPANFALDPGSTLYRDDSAPAPFSLFFDAFGKSVPTGVYYLALWLDPNNSLAESNESNNASLSWSTVAINNGLGPSAAADYVRRLASEEHGSITPGEAYNGKILPGVQGSARQVRISSTPRGKRQVEFLDTGASRDNGQRIDAAPPRPWAKLAHARQQVIFPVTEMKPMPKGN